MRVRTVPLRLAGAIGVLAAAAATMAMTHAQAEPQAQTAEQQQAEEAVNSDIVVVAPRALPMPPHGAPSTTRPEGLATVKIFVLHNDLDLSQQADAVRLMERIEKTAHQACDYLDLLYPLVDDSECVRRATASATPAARAAIAASARPTSGDKPLAGGGAGEIEAIIRSLMMTFSGDAKNYERELNATGIANILSVANINSDPDLSRSKLMIERARSVVQKYRQLTAIRIEAMPSMIKEGDISAPLKEDVMDGMNETLPKTKILLERAWELQAGIVDEYEAVIELLSRTKGSWQVAGDQVAFERQADLAAYQAHLTKIQSMANEANNIRQEGSDSMTSSLNKLSQLQ